MIILGALTRLGQAGVTLWIATFITFVLLRLAPGDPIVMMLGDKAQDPVAVAAIRARYHLDQGMLTQYRIWLWEALHGNLGQSYLFRGNVSDLVGQRLPTTVLLVALSSVFMIAFGFFVGLASARLGRTANTVTSLLLSIGLAMPTYVIAIALITVFSLYLDWFPVFGSGSGLLGRLHHLILPAVTLALAGSAAMARVTRAAVIEEGSRDHVVTARARGLAPRHIHRHHVVRNALLPVTTMAGLNVAALVAGTVVVEKAYGLDGLGSLLVLAITRKDYPVVQSVTFLIVAGFLVVNAIVDSTYAAIDPRTQLSRTR